MSVIFSKNQDTKKARGAFKDLSLKPMDWPEAIWEAYLAFEHLHGTVEDVEICLEKVEKAQFIVNEKRTKVSVAHSTTRTPLNLRY